MSILKNNLPVFPLSGAILFPKSNLPLNIFEKRYLEMVDYSLSNNKTIGMIQEMEKSNKLYKIGCCGKITSFHETNDGRYLINLYGIKLFKIIKEINSKNKFRMFEVEFLKSNNDFDLKESNISKSLLLKKFKSFVNKTDIQTSLESIESIDIKDLVKILAMSCPFTISEKQLLLESKNGNILIDKLIALFDLYNNQYNYKKTLN
tara:strand:+ start:71 stop:685 length:615 start_codon:yes stop_codon:yes gene_type:complete